MTKNIEFVYWNEYAWDVCERPRPASSYIPKWFKDFPPYDFSDKLEISERASNASPKKCRPMLDGIMSGYIIPLWSDVIVSRKLESLDISWRVKENVFDLHGETTKQIPPPAGYQNIVFKYKSMLTIKTPPGYSVMINQPNGHTNSPFFAVSAVLDTDGINHALDFPVWIREDLSGIVEKGEPMVQVTPFKRENWKSGFSYMTEKESAHLFDREIASTIKNRYIKKVWSKKEYR